MLWFFDQKKKENVMVYGDLPILRLINVIVLQDD